jgi:hypothetical protein
MMIPRLVEYLNQTILVSIPALRSDVKCRSYTLVGVELQGLWLQSEELLRDLTADERGEGAPAGTPAFVSFSHIAFVVLPAPVQKLAGFPASLRSAASLPPDVHAAAARNAEHKRTRDAALEDAEAARKRKRGK